METNINSTQKAAHLWFYLYDTLEKTKLTRTKTDYWLPGAGAGVRGWLTTKEHTRNMKGEGNALYLDGGGRPLSTSQICMIKGWILPYVNYKSIFKKYFLVNYFCVRPVF